MKNLKHWCDYCGDGKDKDWAKCWTVIKQNGADEEVVTIKYCPMCGRKLTT
jgi:hypothetical protein